jgi:hypothetical protein
MAQINQLGGVDVLSLPVKNYGGSDIPDGSCVILDTANPGSSNSPRGVTLPASDVKAWGFAIGTIPAGKVGLARVYGVAPGIASGTLHVGDVVMSDSTGAVLAQTAGKYQVGIAQSEAVSGDRVLVLIERAKNA